MKARTRARAVALQVLYEVDLVNHSPVEAFQARLEEEPLPPELEEFARQIIFGVLPRRPHLDQMIARYAPEWPLDQIPAIDRNILRIAVWEFAISKQTPIKVAINEAVEIAKAFGSDSSSRFVNGVLGSLAASENEIRQALQES